MLQELPKPLQAGERISAAMTPVLKWFPIIWLGIALPAVSVGIGVLLQRQPIDGYAMGILLSLLLILSLVGGWLIRWFWGCADVVVVRSEGLQVRRGSIQTLVPWEEIEGHKLFRSMNPPMMTLQLRKPTDLGLKVQFFALPVLMGFGMHPKTRALLEKMKQA